MVTTSQIQLPTTERNTPVGVPYRLDTDAVIVVHRPIPTVQLEAIRRSIEPNQGWWQFPLPRIPWQVSLALGVYSAVVGLGVVAISFAVYLGAHR